MKILNISGSGSISKYLKCKGFVKFLVCWFEVSFGSE